MMQVFNFELECVIKTFELIQGRQEGAAAVLLHSDFLMLLDHNCFFIVDKARQIRSNIIYHF